VGTRFRLAIIGETVRMFHYETPRKLIAAIISPRGGEEIDLDFP
jgi:hypothetical protein